MASCILMRFSEMEGIANQALGQVNVQELRRQILLKLLPFLNLPQLAIALKWIAEKISSEEDFTDESSALALAAIVKLAEGLPSKEIQNLFDQMIASIREKNPNTATKFLRTIKEILARKEDLASLLHRLNL